MQLNNKKEISCKALISLINASKKKNLDLNRLTEGVPYEVSYLLNKHERIEWEAACKIISNSRPFFSRSEYEQMGKDFVENEVYIEGVIFSFILFSSNKLNKILKSQILKGANSIVNPIFSCIHQQSYFIEKNKIGLYFYLDPGYEHCPEFFYMSIGVLEKLGSNKKGFKVDFSLTSNGGIYEVSWEEAGLIFKMNKWIRWLFNIRKAFLELTESHDELVNQYNKLEESKKLLQKQTTQLRTAHEIIKSIKQSLDINKTLKAITGALVNEGTFASAHIKLFKDIEGNKFDVSALDGTGDVNMKQIKQPIIINDEKIGEIIMGIKPDRDITEPDELFNYLLPVINISIHDSLVVRAITDYKNNLETKVDERTAELKKAQYKLSEIIQLQNRFFTNISHEFRTPLTLIIGPSKQISERTGDEKIRDDADLINRNAKKLSRLANQLLDISRIEAGRMSLQTCEQNIVPVIRRIVYSFKSFAEKKHISLNFNPEAEDIILYIDEDKIDKILSNILSNAFKFTPPGGCVNVKIHKLQDKVQIAVSDNGIGIPEEHLCKIFDRFYQVDNRLSKEYEGTGIGLSLTRELMEIHKGNISVESEEGKGSTFNILLPLGKEHLQEEEIVKKTAFKEINTNENIELSSSSDDFISIKDLNNKKDSPQLFENNNKPLLLVIEDYYDVRKYIIEILHNYYKITEAGNGEEGLVKAFNRIPDLIISDIMMPGMDGTEICHTLKNDSRTSHIPIILLTAKVTLRDKIDGLEAGADDYIMKPFDEQELKARITNLLEQRRRIHEHFQKYEIDFGNNSITPIDQKFLQNVIEIINQHISDEEFSVEILAENAAVSRSLLHKKLIALVGEPPSELIKRIRLKKAAKLIENKSGNISEIALQVGFKNPAYFAECFHKQFGINPSRYHSNSGK